MSNNISEKSIEYIYLLILREFKNSKENVYKIGRTKQENHKRFNQYPKGSSLLLQIICNDCTKNEKDILKIFREKFKHRTEFGNEYFEGNYKEMINIIFSTIQNEICKEEIECDFRSKEIEYDMLNTFFSELTIKEAEALEKSYNYDVYFTPCIICGENAVGKGHGDRYHTIQSFDINYKGETNNLRNFSFCDMW